MPSSIKHILVIRLSALGDVAMTVPILRVLKTNYPELKVTVLTRQQFKPLFDDLKDVSVFGADVYGKHKGVLGLRRLSKELKALEIDAVADLHNVLRSKILKIFFGKIPFQQIDKGRAEKKALVSGKLFKQLKTTHERYADVFRHLGFEIDLTQHQFPQKRVISTHVKEHITTTDMLIGIAPFAAFEGKMYPLHLMEQVISTLSRDYNILLFGGGKKEIEALDAIQNNNKNIVNLAGKLSFSEELDVISNLDLMIAMDSANAHLAALFGVKTLTIWGVTHPYAGFAPFGQPKENMLLADREAFTKIPTSVYGKTFPNGYENAIETISPNGIITKAISILEH